MASNSKTYSIGLFLLFCLIASIAWFLIRYRSVYTHQQEFAITFIEKPIEIELRSPGREYTFTADVRASGFYLIYLDIASPEIQVPFSKFVEVRDSMARIELEDMTPLLKQQLPSAIEISDYKQSFMDVPLKVTASKKIPLLVSTEVNTDKGYRMDGMARIIPDSVVVTGEKDELEKWDSLRIKDIHIQLDRDSVVRGIDLGSYIDLKHTPDSVNIHVKGIQMTEGTITKKVEIRNPPENAKVRVIPEEVRITYRSSTADFEKINSELITPVIDLKSVSQDNFSTIPDVYGLGDQVSDYTLTPNQVQVLVIK